MRGALLAEVGCTDAEPADGAAVGAVRHVTEGQPGADTWVARAIAYFKDNDVVTGPL
ncbi:hypothetical protein [Streptomyces sp. NPDC127595]|uniref:hypothetical protein n=1 Tax=Streptomyces sp. NPDC127595 TaxID=3345405 RepID=UPI0036304866